MARIKRIVIHCTATPAGREVTADEIHHWHLDPKPKGNGWHHLGYHILIHLNGSISFLQPLPAGQYIDNSSMANGVKGYNDSSLHVCYVGGLDASTLQPADTRTTEQRKALFLVLLSLARMYGNKEIVGHHDLNPLKACPCFDAKKEYRYVL